jgi:DNA-binding response OmpR family regulator
MDKKRILIIEDEGDQTILIQMRLETMGYEVLTAAKGQIGLDLATKEQPDLVILDIMLPDLDGFIVCQKLKESPETKHIPIFIITAMGTDDLERKCKSCGADHMIRKPYDAKDLLAGVRKLVG